GRVGGGGEGAGAGVEPALSGPTLSTPRSSTQAIEPPPAPIELTATVGMKIGNSPIISPTPYCGTPSRMKATSALVPPMSRLMVAGNPARLATWAAPITPAAVPERI